MSQFPKPVEEFAAKEDTHPQDFEVILLDRRQWSYVQRRYDLTPREREIAELICQGLRNGSIAKRLRIRPGTVKTHIRNVYRKVRVKNKITMLLTFVTDSKLISAEYDGTPSVGVTD